MKEGFWKKVLVGVVASLITLSAASLASSIFQRIRPDEEVESAATCTHTKIIEVSGVAPTCTESGLTDGIFCGVCHGVIKAQHVIDPLGHIVVDVPGYAATCTATGLTDGKTCSVCEAVIVAQQTIPKNYDAHNYEDSTCVDCGMTDTSEFEEVEVATGELVAGNWYRMYRGNSMNLSGEIINPSYESTLCVYAGTLPNQGQNGFIECAGRYTNCILEGIAYVITEEYIDVYFNPGVYKLSETSRATYEITEETTITSISGTIYRLVPPGGETNEESSS